MARKASDLAARLRAAVDREGDDRTVEEEARLARLKGEREARDQLFEDLQAFGNETGFLEVVRDEGVVLRFGERELAFRPLGEGGNVQVDFTGRAEKTEHRLYREPAMGDRWVWVRRKRSSEDRLVLFEEGLELLMVHALDLPDPSEPEDDAPREVQPAASTEPASPTAPTSTTSGKKRTL